MPQTKDASNSAYKLESSPPIRTAIEAAATVMLRGSLMSAAQRRDHVLDRLIVESEKGGDSARVRSLELLGKTAGLFQDKAEHVTTAGQGVRQRIDALLQSILMRDVIDPNVASTELAAECVNDVNDDDSHPLDSPSHSFPKP